MRSPVGATLYVPATHRDLRRIADGVALPTVRSLIFCTEDAVAEQHLESAMSNLSGALAGMRPAVAAQRFVRVRNPDVLARVLAMPGVDNLTGFVLPKATRHTFAPYMRLVRSTRHLLMPTLETAEVFSDLEMQRFRALLEAPGVRPRILALRIGGNDLLALLGLRRPRTMTIYRTPLGAVIGRLVTTFAPCGFGLTAPAFEHIDLPELLAEEMLEDLAHGLVGKTAIHPSQVPLIDQHYRVRAQDLAAAHAILDRDSPAVFQQDGSMCEVATHRPWAERVIAQSRVFGTEGAVAAGAPLLTMVSGV